MSEEERKRLRALDVYFKAIEAGLMSECDWARFRELYWPRPTAQSDPNPPAY